MLIETPCCSHNLSLNDLDYHWPAGFARYHLEARDPSGEFTDEHRAAVEGILHCSLRLIWAHY
jgi:hypothetical protein